jgi:hypothetical protein
MSPWKEMTMFNCKALLGSLCLASMVAGLGAGQTAMAYTVTIIHPTYSGAGSYSRAYGISPNGKVTGIGTVSISHPFPGPPPNIKGLTFLWTPTAANGTTQSTYTQTGTFLTAFGATGLAAWNDHGTSYGTAVNDSGEVVGNATEGGVSTFWGFCWDGSSASPGPASTKGYRFTNGQSPPNYRESNVSGAYAISPLGTCIASAPFPAPNTNYTGTIGDIVSSDGIVASFGSVANGNGIGFPFGLDPSGKGMSFAYGINDYEQVVGSANTSSSLAQVPFLQDSGTYYNLGLPTGATAAWGYRINTEGEILVETGTVGWFLWQPTTTRGTTGSYSAVPGSAGSYTLTPRGMSWNSGAALVVGIATFGGSSYAWQWTPGGSAQDLNSLYPTANFTFRSAEAVNDYGQIVGYGDWVSGGVTYQRAFIINP